MQNIQQALFILISGAAIFLFAKKITEIKRNILLGKEEDLNDRKGDRWRNLMLNARYI